MYSTTFRNEVLQKEAQYGMEHSSYLDFRPLSQKVPTQHPPPVQASMVSSFRLLSRIINHPTYLPVEGERYNLFPPPPRSSVLFPAKELLHPRSHQTGRTPLSLSYTI